MFLFILRIIRILNLFYFHNQLVRQADNCLCPVIDLSLLFAISIRTVSLFHVIQDAWDEQVTTYEDYAWDCCNVCGADCTADPGGHAYQHAIKGEGGGHHTEYDSRPVTKTVHHDAVYGTRWVQDTAAYDETVVDGYVCSCGARK